MFEDYFDPLFMQKRRLMEQQAALTGVPQDPGVTSQQYAAQSEPERQSWLDQAYEDSLGGLSYVGKVLDKTFGGRAVRGLLGGSPEELLSIIPMSDTLGITNSANEVSGRQLLDNAGLTTAGDDSWVNTIAGVGAEMLLDPSTYLTLGGTTAAGQAAKMAGTSTKGLAAGIRAGERNLIGLGLPFGQQRLLFGTGDAAANFVDAVPRVAGNLAYAPVKAAEYAAKPLEWATGFNPVTSAYNAGSSLAGGLGRALRTHFNTGTAGAVTREVQPIAESIYSPGLKAYGQPFERQAADVIVDLDPILRAGGAKERQALESMRVAAEIPADSKPFFDRIKTQYDETIGDLGQKLTRGEIGQSAFDEGIIKAQGLRDDTLARIDMQKQWATNRIAGAIDSKAFSPEEIDRLRKSVETIGSMSGQAHALRQSKGIVSNTLDDIINYGTQRELNELPALQGEGLWTAAKRKGASTMGAYDPSQIQRDELFKNIPGGSVFVNDLVRNQDLRKLAIEDPENAAGVVRSLLVGTPNPPKNWPVWGQADKMVDFLGSVDKRYAEHGADYFSLDIAHSAKSKGLSTAKVAAQADAVERVATQTAQKAGVFADQGRASIPVEELLNKAGFTKDGPGYQRIVSELMGEQAAKPKGELANFGDLTGLAIPGKNPREGFNLKDYHVPEDVAADVMRLGEAWKSPAALAPVIEGWKMAMNIFKTGVTAPFPAFNVRNVMNAVFSMWRDKALDFGAMGAARAVQNGGYLPEKIAAKAYPGLSVEAATEAFKKDLVATNTAYTRNARQSTGDIIGQASSNITSSSLPNTTGQATGELQNLTNFFKGYAPTAEGKAQGFGAMRQLFDPTLVEGGLTNTNINRFVDQGRKFGGAAEDWIRSSHFLAKKMEGFTSDVASDAVKKYHIDYSAITPTERAIKSVVPWYGFCVPLDHLMLTRDGWKSSSQLTVGEEVMGYCHLTGNLQWEKLEAVNVFDVNEDLIRMSCRGTEFLCTKNHRWPSVKVRHFVKGRWYGGEREYVLADDLDYQDRIPLTGKFQSKDSVLCPRLAAIVGWVVSDGSIRWKKNHCEMVVYQSAEKHAELVSSLLGVAPRKGKDERNPTNPVYTFGVKREDVREITKFMKHKDDLIGVVTRLGSESAEAMYDAMMMASGTNCDAEDGEQQSFGVTAKNQKIADAFQALCCMTGRSASQSKKCLYIRRTNYIYPMNWNFTTVKHKGKVWCPTTPSGGWVMKHDGGVCITGNSRGNLPPILEDLVTRPAKVAQAVRLTAGARDHDQFAPGYIAEGASLPFFGADEGKARYLSSFGLGIEDEAFKMLGSALHGDIKRTVGAGFGMLNPYMKAIPEQAFGTQFYSGRNLADLEPSTLVSLGGLVPQRTAQTLTQFFANTPAARVISTADRAMDTRKWDGSGALNLLTGLRVSDVDLERTKAAAQREFLQQQLRPSSATKVREEVYVPVEKRGQLNPVDQYMMDQLMGIQKQQSAAARDRRASAR